MSNSRSFRRSIQRGEIGRTHTDRDIGICSMSGQLQGRTQHRRYVDNMHAWLKKQSGFGFVGYRPRWVRKRIGSSHFIAKGEPRKGLSHSKFPHYRLKSVKFRPRKKLAILHALMEKFGSTDETQRRAA